jgi:hypothetical protein
VSNGGSIAGTPTACPWLLSRSPQQFSSSSSTLLSTIAIAAHRRAVGGSTLGGRALTQDAEWGTRGQGGLGQGLFVDPLGDPTLGEVLMLGREAQAVSQGDGGMRLAAAVPSGRAAARGHRRSMSYDPPSQLRMLGYSELGEARGWLAGSRISQFISATLDHEIIVRDEPAAAGTAADTTCPASPPPPAPLQLSQLSHLVPGASASQLDLSPIIRPLSTSRRRERWGLTARISSQSRVADERGEPPWLLLEQTDEAAPDEAGGAGAGACSAGPHAEQGRTAGRARESGAEML